MSNFTPNQEKAINDFGTNIIVSAGAGSGKTTVLTERVVNHIKNGIHINEMLILTFTNKAAMEMKNRIRVNLANYKNELDMLPSSYITTFDSYALSIVKKYHYLLNIPKSIKITDEGIVKTLEIKILDEVFDEFYLKNDSVFNDLIFKYCIKNDEVFKKTILNIFHKINEYSDYKTYIDNFYNNDNIDNLINKYYKLLETKRNNINICLDNLSSYFDSDYIEKVYNSVQSLLTIDIRDVYKIDSIKLPPVPRGSLDDAKDAKEELKNSIDELLLFNKYKDYDSIKNSILSDKKDVSMIMDIISLFVYRLEEYKNKNNIYTFSDIAKLSIKILKDNDFVREEIKSSFKEIMIDEYQDTNDLEEEFISLISNNNVYMVGDIKQSIYRFRGSNPNIFKEKYENLKTDGIVIDLLENFRSRSEVLESINNIFDLIMDFNIGGAAYKESHEMIAGNKIYDSNRDFDYDLEVLEYNNDTKYKDYEVEIFAIANDIKSKVNNKVKVFDRKAGLRNIEYGDFSIILDRSTHFKDYKRIFEYLGIPLTILKDDDLTLDTDICLIKNIFDIVLRINDKDFGVEFKYDFMSIGRSFLYEYSDNELFDIFKDNSFINTKIYKDFSIDINSITSPRLFEIILDTTDFYNKIYKVGDYKNITNRLKVINDLAIELNNKGYTIKEFKEYLDSVLESGINIKYESKSDNSNSVKILTIHASKGLEYPVCYYSDLNHKFNKSDLKDIILADKKYGIILNDNIIKELFKDEYLREELSEKIRLFYVALTRAKEKMIVVIPEVKDRQYLKEDGVIASIYRNRFNKLIDLISCTKYYLPIYFNSIDLNSVNLTKDYLYPKDIKSLDKDNNILNVEEIFINNEEIDNKHFSKEKLDFVDRKTESKMNIGTKVHEILEYIDFNTKEVNIDNSYIKNKIIKFLNSDLIKDINKAKVYREFEFIYEDDTLYHGVIDLMLEYDDHIDIIDYKLKNVTDEAYIKQLNGYKNYIKKVSNKIVNTYLYSILDETVTEIK